MALKDLLGGLVGAVPGGSAVKAAASILGRFISTPEDKQALAELADRAEKREHEVALAQIATNTAEASHRSIFVAGWRPYVGWGLGTVMIVLGFVCAWRILVGQEVPDLAPMAPFFYTLGGMLGLGAALRTREKRAGVAR